LRPTPPYYEHKPSTIARWRTPLGLARPARFAAAGCGGFAARRLLAASSFEALLCFGLV